MNSCPLGVASVEELGFLSSQKWTKVWNELKKGFLATEKKIQYLLKLIEYCELKYLEYIVAKIYLC